MLLVDALYINNSGGKILLDYLITELEKNSISVKYLLDDRIKDNHPTIKTTNGVVYMEGSLRKRYFFYKTLEKSIHKVFCFGNLPPMLKLNIPVYTYFHQTLFLEIPATVPLKQKIVLKIKTFIFKKLMANTTFWIVQTNVVKKKFLSAYPSVNNDAVLILPFFQQFKTNNLENIERENNSFVYVSNGSPHKNHIRLMEAFVQFYDKYKIGKLFLTMGTEFTNLHALINELKLKGYPIVNLGFLSREELEKLYRKSEFLIFPSLAESFGLGLIEAMENGCKVIGADLEYTYAVCKPSLVFDPYNVNSISQRFFEATTKNIAPTKQLVFNKIDELIELLK